jgi:hypothetical protein
VKRRTFLATLGAGAALTTLRPRWAWATESALQILAGPVTPMGSTAYDVVHAAKMAVARDGYPEVTPITPYTVLTLALVSTPAETVYYQCRIYATP